jgi:DNA-binding response OmpR family regulator
MKILLLEDDTLLAQSVIEELEDAGYSVTWAQESDRVIDLTYDNHFDLYLFDVNVPGINGFELLHSLRESGDTTAAIFMTSRNQIDDIRQGFGVGANDYIKKPFDLDELLVRIESKLPQNHSTQLSAEFRLDPQSYEITCKNQTHQLPPKEFDLINYFVTHQDQLLNPHDIIEEFSDAQISIATFRTYIKNLKRHIGECGVIENVKGVGYRFKLL